MLAAIGSRPASFNTLVLTNNVTVCIWESGQRKFESKAMETGTQNYRKAVIYLKVQFLMHHADRPDV